jgi:hypothetical protein
MSHYAENLQDALLLWGRPIAGEIPNCIKPTGAVPGSFEKIKILAERAAINAPLFHSQDRVDYSGLTEEVHIFKRHSKEILNANPMPDAGL